MTNFEYLISLIMLVLVGYGGGELIRKLIRFIKSKIRRKKPDEIQREVEKILKEHNG